VTENCVSPLFITGKFRSLPAGEKHQLQLQTWVRQRERVWPAEVIQSNVMNLAGGILGKRSRHHRPCCSRDRGINAGGLDGDNRDGIVRTDLSKLRPSDRAPSGAGSGSERGSVWKRAGGFVARVSGGV